MPRAISVPVNLRREVLWLRNRQRTRPVDLRLLRRISLTLLKDFLPPSSFEIGVHLVEAVEITELNETFLHHAGSTDVITFDYSVGSKLEGLQGEIFICLSEAVAQARRFRTSWAEELTRYLIHGLLHLSGYDDLKPALRREMKREEDRLVRKLRRRFTLLKLRKSRSNAQLRSARR